MKKRLLALAVGSFVAFPAVALADSGPTVYGKVNVSYDNEDNGTDDAWNLNSNASRLGFKGDLDLDFQDVKAIYQAEYQLSVDDGGGEDPEFSQRNIFGGFESSSAGTLIAGKFDTPFKAAQGGIDQFGDLAGDIGAIVEGENRVSNIIQYSTPKLGDVFHINVALIPGEGDQTDPDGERRDGFADGISSSAVFDNGTFYGALAYDSDVAAGGVYDAGDVGTGSGLDVGTGYTVDAIRAVGVASIQNFELGALVQQTESNDASNGVDYEDTSYILSGAVNVDRWKFKAQYGMTDMDQSDDELQLMALGADYKVGDNSKVFGQFAQIEADENTAELDDTIFGIGFEHKFSM